MSFCLSCFLRASKFFGASDPSDSLPSRVTPSDSNKPRICDRAFVPAEVDNRILLGLRQGFPSTRSGLISGRGAPGKQEHSQKVDCRSRSAAHLQCQRRSIREVRGVRGVRRAGRRRMAVGVGWGQGKHTTLEVDVALLISTCRRRFRSQEAGADYRVRNPHLALAASSIRRNFSLLCDDTLSIPVPPRPSKFAPRSFSSPALPPTRLSCSMRPLSLDLELASIGSSASPNSMNKSLRR